MTTVMVKKVSITHDNIIDFVISRPSASYREIARVFSYSPEGIGIICRSDSFKARLQVRKAELVDPLITQSLEERFSGLAHASIDILQEKLRDSADPKLALAVLDSTTRARAAEYGARNPGGGNTTFVVQLPGPAVNSAEWASKFQRVLQPVEVAVEQLPDLSGVGQREPGQREREREPDLASDPRQLSLLDEAQG